MNESTEPIGAEGGRRSREAALAERLRQLPSLVIAYSGGVDSAYLAWAAVWVAMVWGLAAASFQRKDL